MEGHGHIQPFFLFVSYSILIHIEIFDNATLRGWIFDNANIQYQRIQ